MPQRKTLLVVDDEADLRKMLSELLSDRYDCVFANGGKEAIRHALKKAPDLVLLDALMPDLNGIKVCEALRANPATAAIPVIMLTALNKVEDRVRAFQTGADDYLAKPFSPEELVARIDSKLRRQKRLAPIARKTVLGNLTIDHASLKVSVADRKVKLTALEIRLIELFIVNKGRVLPRKEILGKIFDSAKPKSRLIDPHIVALRRKLAAFDHKIETVYGHGYVLSPFK